MDSGAGVGGGKAAITAHESSVLRAYFLAHIFRVYGADSQYTGNGKSVYLTPFHNQVYLKSLSYNIRNEETSPT
jgi:hypothetical protein